MRTQTSQGYVNVPKEQASNIFLWNARGLQDVQALRQDFVSKESILQCEPLLLGAISILVVLLTLMPLLSACYVVSSARSDRNLATA